MTYRTLFGRLYRVFSGWYPWRYQAPTVIESSPPPTPIKPAIREVSIQPRRIAGIRGAGMDRKVNKRKSDLARLRAIR